MKHNGGKKKMMQEVCTRITSKRIELESPGWSGVVRFLIFFKTWPTGIRLELIMEQSWYVKSFKSLKNWYLMVIKLYSYEYNF